MVLEGGVSQGNQEHCLGEGVKKGHGKIHLTEVVADGAE